jgi:transposase
MEKYTQEFREEAVRLVLESKGTTAQVAADLGIKLWTLREWMKKYRKEIEGTKQLKPETLEEENRRLKREVTILRQEKEILKKAAAYFAKEQM